MFGQKMVACLTEDNGKCYSQTPYYYKGWRLQMTHCYIIIKSYNIYPGNR